jgi:hypothetical protein
MSRIKLGLEFSKRPRSGWFRSESHTYDTMLPQNYEDIAFITDFDKIFFGRVKTS